MAAAAACEERAVGVARPQHSADSCLAQAVLDAALQSGVLEARAEACQIEMRVLAAALVGSLQRIGRLAQFGIGCGQWEVEQRMGRVARPCRLEQSHGIGVATAEEIGDAKIERSLGSDVDVEAHGELG